MENDITIWERQFPKGIPKDLKIHGTSSKKNTIVESTDDKRQIESLKKDVSSLKKDIKDIKLMINKIIRKHKKSKTQHITNENNLDESNTQQKAV